MSTHPQDHPTRPAPSRLLLRAAIALVASFALGGATFYAQGLESELIDSFANSASGWTVLTALLVFFCRLPTLQAAFVGAGCFILLTVGYAAAADLNGLYYDPLFFSVVGVVAGPFVGVAASWLRGTAVRAAIGTALLAGIGVGDSFFGLTTVLETTGPSYWVTIGTLGLALLAVMLVRTVRGAVPVIVAAGGTVALALLYVLAFRGLSSIAMVV